MTAGRIKCSSKGSTLIRGEEQVSTRDGERHVYQYLSSAEGLGGFQDHFDWWGTSYGSENNVIVLFIIIKSLFFFLNRWARNTYSILGGKPLWIDPFDPKVQHIFIDDNIRQNDEDTIVHPKVLDVCFLFSRLTVPYVLPIPLNAHLFLQVFLDPEGLQTRTASTSELYDLCLVQNDLLKAISEPGYFTRRIQICMENYEGNIQKG